MSLSVHTIDSARELENAWPDFYFSPQYGRIVESSDDGEWQVALWNDGAIIYPYLKRAIPDSDHFDIISPYGYAGIYVREDQQVKDLSAFRTAFRDHAQNNGIVSEFLRMSAITTSDDLLAKADPALNVSPHNSTLLIDVSEDYDVFFARAEGRARTKVRKARKLGYTSEIHPADRDFFAPGSPFRTLYHDTMTRIEAKPYYFFNDDYFMRFHDELGDRVYSVEARNAEGEIAMAGFFMLWAPYLHLHLVGSTGQALRDGVSNFFYDAVAAWGCDHPEIHKMHVGGGQKDGDSLYKFKLSFGGVPTRFSLGRSILDPKSYLALTAERAKTLGVSDEALRESGFFPSYRAELGS